MNKILKQLRLEDFKNKQRIELTSYTSYPAFTKSNYLENTVEPDNLFEFRVTEKIINTTSNFENYVKAAKCAYPIVHENGEITKGETYWSGVSYDGFSLPAQKDSKDYCK